MDFWTVFGAVFLAVLAASIAKELGGWMLVLIVAAVSSCIPGTDIEEG